MIATSTQQVGFKVTGHGELNGWKPVDTTKLEFTERPACPITGAPLTVVAVLRSLKYDEQIRVGCCPDCGLVGYIDCPTEASINRYYASEWMGETETEAYQKAWDFKQQLDERFRLNPVTQLDAFQFDRERMALDIGCGYGNTIHTLMSYGFRVVNGVEACGVRAKATRSVYGIVVAEDAWPDAWPRTGTAALISSHHVLEHVYDPDKFLAGCARHQRDGDALWLSLPEFDGEPAVGVLMFLPHLWSFTANAMRLLLLWHGYQIEHEERRPMNYACVARKSRAEIQPNYDEIPDHVGHCIRKLSAGLGLSIGGPSQLVWQRNIDGTIIGNNQHISVREPVPRVLLIDTPEPFATDAPIEIQFADHVFMFNK